jgi:hypothetical protein
MEWPRKIFMMSTFQFAALESNVCALFTSRATSFVASLNCGISSGGITMYPMERSAAAMVRGHAFACAVREGRGGGGRFQHIRDSQQVLIS